MEHYAGTDGSLELSSVCVVDAQGKIVKEAKIASEPEAFIAFFQELGFAVKQIGLEAGPLSQWLHAGPMCKLVLPMQRPANHGRPLQKPTTHEL